MATTVEYNGSVVATIPNGNKATIPIANKKMKTDIVITVPKAEGGTDSPLPIEVSTEAEMTALLTSGEVGGVYKYTGETTDTYENGALYVLEELITFVVADNGATTDSYTLYAEEGMTWVEWCASDYNTVSSCYVSGETVYFRGQSIQDVSAYDTITATTYYYTTSGSGGSGN